MFQPVHQSSLLPFHPFTQSHPSFPPHPIQSFDFRTLIHSHGIKTFICVSPPAWSRFERRKQTCTRWRRDGKGWSSPRSRARCSSNRLFRTVTRSTLISNDNFLYRLLSFFFFFYYFSFFSSLFSIFSLRFRLYYFSFCPLSKRRGMECVITGMNGSFLVSLLFIFFLFFKKGIKNKIVFIFLIVRY